MLYTDRCVGFTLTKLFSSCRHTTQDNSGNTYQKRSVHDLYVGQRVKGLGIAIFKALQLNKWASHATKCAMKHLWQVCKLLIVIFSQCYAHRAIIVQADPTAPRQHLFSYGVEFKSRTSGRIQVMEVLEQLVHKIMWADTHMQIHTHTGWENIF